MMAFMIDGSAEVATSQLDLFSIPSTNTSIEEGTYVNYNPISSLTDSSPIEFDITSSGETFIDLASTYLHVQAKILRADGSEMQAGDECGPVNNFLHSLFAQLDIYLNGTLITSSTATYSYRAYLENLLTYGPAAKKSYLTSSLFYKDDAGRMDSSDPFAGAGEVNLGLQKRASFVTRSRTVDLIGRLHADICFQPRYLLNEISMKIRLTRNRDSFCLMCAGAHTYKVVIQNCSLLVRKVKLNPSVFLAHAKILESGNAIYPIHRTQIKTVSIARGFMSCSFEKIFSGQIPTRLVIALVDNDALNGSFTKNPYNFKHFSMSEISIFLDGQSHSLKPLTMNFVDNTYIRAYLSLFNGTSMTGFDSGNDITREDFAGGYAIYVFDLTPDLYSDESFNLIRQGSVRIDVKFRNALENTVSLLVYGEFENIIQISRDRSVVFDFAS